MTVIILPVQLGDGSDDVLEIEADLDEQDPGLQLVAARDGTRRLPSPAFSLAAAMDKVVPVLDRIIDRVRQTGRRPDEIAVELGLKIGGEHGVILTKGTAEANVKLTVKWFAGGSRADADASSAGGEPANPDNDGGATDSEPPRVW